MARGDRAFMKKLIRLPAVRGAVREERDAIASRARSLFAAHDRPGGHSITTSNGAVDAYVWLEGPAPVALERGHFARDGKTFVEGIHVMGRAARR